MDELRIVEAGPERIAGLEPLWRALHEHHQTIAEGVAEVRPFEDSWRLRRAQYEGWLTGGQESGLFLAERAGRIVGYLMITAGPGAATWDLGERVAEMETLSVLPDERGSGVGAALMDASRRWAGDRGIRTIAVGLAHTNDGARRFYEREGFRPFYTEMICPLGPP